MLRDDRSGLKPAGRLDEERDRHLERLQEWRALPADLQRIRIGGDDEPFEPSSVPDQGRLRVGLWCPCLGLGGAEVWQLALARSVDASRIVWKGAAVLDGRGSSDPRMVRELSAFMPVGHGSSVARSIASVSDVIVTWAVANVADLLDGLANPPAVVMACHFPRESPWGPRTEDLLAPVQRFVAVSELAVESTPATVRDRLEVVWNAVDASRLQVQRSRSEVRTLWKIPNEARVAGYLGRLSSEKDPHAMLRLAAVLGDDWHVVIVGEGRERETLGESIDTNQLDKVHLVGGDSRAGDVLNAFDTLVVPSRYESFGLTLAEGLWFGIPVIATACGIARLVPGLVREVPTNPSGIALREAIDADLADAEGTRRRVEQGQAFARDRLSLRRFGSAWTRLLISAGEHRKEIRA